EREMAERWHGATLDQANPSRALRPLCVALEGELGAPAKLARRRREPMLERATQTCLGTDAADQDDLTARLENARELVERGFRMRRSGDHVLRYHDVERIVRKGQALGVHHPEAFDVGEPELGDPLLRLAQHLLGNVDAAKLAVPGIMRQRDTGADADFQNATTDAL